MEVMKALMEAKKAEMEAKKIAKKRQALKRTPGNKSLPISREDVMAAEALAAGLELNQAQMAKQMTPEEWKEYVQSRKDLTPLAFGRRRRSSSKTRRRRRSSKTPSQYQTSQFQTP